METTNFPMFMTAFVFDDAMRFLWDKEIKKSFGSGSAGSGNAAAGFGSASSGFARRPVAFAILPALLVLNVFFPFPHAFFRLGKLAAEIGGVPQIGYEVVVYERVAELLRAVAGYHEVG